LAALVRTCRTFKEPALDVLWSELVDLTPLPRCIPAKACSFSYALGVRTSICCNYFSNVCPTPQDYSFARQRCRVGHPSKLIWHILGYSNPNGRLDNQSLILAICCSPAVGPLFPNLRAFHWKGIEMIPSRARCSPDADFACSEHRGRACTWIRGFPSRRWSPLFQM
ncbi:hypothetical protein L210DRAFT_3410851, partial [Boletus edulis BED1]